ncbi:hypothetical protein MK852_11720 [Shewanella benthica]|uniref:hypothetical protein n=1 Tax=Shewanella benthica TaxID=43661 RepID=UPI001D0D39C6|nr:hypothetical protein [Shewanella benthica]MCL1062796.1 hypothetical protein [Shewanella benthica]
MQKRLREGFLCGKVKAMSIDAAGLSIKLKTCLLFFDVCAYAVMNNHHYHLVY